MIVKRDQVPWQMGVESEVDFLRVPVAQRMETTMDGLLASSSSFITPFSYGFFDDVNRFGVGLRKFLDPSELQHRILSIPVSFCDLMIISPKKISYLKCMEILLMRHIPAPNVMFFNMFEVSRTLTIN